MPPVSLPRTPEALPFPLTFFDPVVDLEPRLSAIPSPLVEGWAAGLASGACQHSWGCCGCCGCLWPSPPASRPDVAPSPEGAGTILLLVRRGFMGCVPLATGGASWPGAENDALREWANEREWERAPGLSSSASKGFAAEAAFLDMKEPLPESLPCLRGLAPCRRGGAMRQSEVNGPRQHVSGAAHGPCEAPI